MAQTEQKYLDLDGVSKLKDMIMANIPSSSNEIKYATFTVDGWIGDASPYTQTVTIEGITAEDDVYIDRDIDYSSDEATISAYNKAFSCIALGVGQTIDGGIEFKVFKKPSIDVRVAISIA